MSELETIELFRPVGPRELARVRESGYQARPHPGTGGGVNDAAELVAALGRAASRPEALYAFIKEIDGDHREGASLIMGQRVVFFCR